MVFTAITYGTLEIQEQLDAKGQLRTLTFQQTATAAAGSEVQYYCPRVSPTTDLEQINGRLRGRASLYRVLSVQIYPEALAGARIMNLFWYVRGQNLHFPAHVTSGGGNPLDLVEGIRTPLLAVSVGAPLFYGRVITTALTATDKFITTVVLEVVE